MFRPYYRSGGPPYAWSQNEKLALNTKAEIMETNLQNIETKCLDKVLNWSSYLCGLVNEAEPILDPEE